MDNIKVSTTAYSPYTYTDDFDSPELNGFAGPFVSYLYNTDDERVMKISPQGVTKYITDGNGQVLVENDGYNNLKYNYIYGNGQKLASINTSGTKEYFHTDYLGSVRRVSTQGGSVTWSRDYYPFGETREATGANEENGYTYEGREKDLETDLWNNWNRHFNDEGRFTQVDPLWNKYPSLSPYVRVANNPMRFVDPYGLEGNDPQDDEYNNGIMGRLRSLFRLNTPTNQVDAVDVVTYTTSQIDAASQAIAEVPGQVVQAGTQISDAVSDVSTVAAIAGIAAAPFTDGASLTLTANALNIGATADITSTVLKTTNALVFGGSKQEAIYQTGSTLLKFGSGKIISNALSRTIVRTGPSVVPAFRSASTGRFFPNAYGNTVTAAADATRIAIGIVF